MHRNPESKGIQKSTTAWSYKRCRSKSVAIRKRPHYDQYGRLHKLLEADVIFGLPKTCCYYQNVWTCVIEQNGKWGHAKNDHRSHIKRKQFQGKKIVIYFQSWHMGTTNKLLQTALKKWMHSSRQPEATVVTYRHIVGENGLGLNRPHHHYQIIQKVLYQQWFRWHRRWCIVG